VPPERTLPGAGSGRETNTVAFTAFPLVNSPPSSGRQPPRSLRSRLRPGPIRPGKFEHKNELSLGSRIPSRGAVRRHHSCKRPGGAEPRAGISRNGAMRPIERIDAVPKAGPAPDGVPEMRSTPNESRITDVLKASLLPLHDHAIDSLKNSS